VGQEATPERKKVRREIHVASEFVASRPVVLLIGRPGSGKTTPLKHLLQQVADPLHPHPSLPDGCVPVLLRARSDPSWSEAIRLGVAGLGLDPKDGYREAAAVLEALCEAGEVILANFCLVDMPGWRWKGRWGQNPALAILRSLWSAEHWKRDLLPTQEKKKLDSRIDFSRARALAMLMREAPAAWRQAAAELQPGLSWDRALNFRERERVVILSGHLGVAGAQPVRCCFTMKMMKSCWLLSPPYWTEGSSTRKPAGHSRTARSVPGLVWVSRNVSSVFERKAASRSFLSAP